VKVNVIDANTLVREDELGHGSYGVVEKMEWMGRSVAVKFVTEATRDRDLLETAHAEAALMAQLHHPCIVTLYGVLGGGKCGLVMEFLSGGSLYQLLKSDALVDAAAKIRFAREIASGVCFLHGNNILHRDVKSANVMLTGDRHCKLIDFGLSQLKEKLQIVGGTKTQSVVGSIEWMAPEIIDSDDADGVVYNKATDVYALGITLWEIAARAIPFQAAGFTPARHARLVTMKIKGTHDEIPNGAPPCIAQSIQRCRADAPLRPSVEELVQLLH
jgi:serine/threonine protein kinase